MSTNKLSEDDWLTYCRDGYLILRGVVSTEDVAELNRRLDDIMLGTVRYPTLVMQLDPTTPDVAKTRGSAADEYTTYMSLNTQHASTMTAGFKGPSLACEGGD